MLRRRRRRGDSASKEKGRAAAPGAAGRPREGMGQRQDGVEGKMDTTNVAPVELCPVAVVEPVEIRFFSEREHEDATKPHHVGI